MKDMTPQEKLAALAEKWRAFAATKRTTEFGHGSANAYREVADELEAILSEHGGGGEAVLSAKPLVWKEESTGWWSDASMGFNIEHNTDPDEAPENRYTASWGEGDSEHFATMDEAKAWCQELADGWVRDCGQITTPPTPSAPVVDDARYDTGLLNDYGGGNVGWWHDYIRAELDRAHDFYIAALSGVSAPVGVEWPRKYRGDEHTTEWHDGWNAAVDACKAAALTPAAAPRVEGVEACPKCGAPTDPAWETNSRSRLRRIAAEKGEPAPRFDGASEDGLPEEWDTLMPKLYEALADKPIALTYELRDAIRRLAASGQGVEGWKLVPANATNNMQIAGLAALDESDATPDSIGHLIGYKAIREAYAAMVAAAPTQEKGNG